MKYEIDFDYGKKSVLIVIKCFLSKTDEKILERGSLLNNRKTAGRHVQVFKILDSQPINSHQKYNELSYIQLHLF